MKLYPNQEFMNIQQIKISPKQVIEHNPRMIRNNSQAMVLSQSKIQPQQNVGGNQYANNPQILANNYAPNTQEIRSKKAQELQNYFMYGGRLEDAPVVTQQVQSGAMPARQSVRPS